MTGSFSTDNATLTHENNSVALEGIAIIGMDGRFPGADSVAAFWKNLCNGVESITTFSDEVLADAGVSAAERQNPHYVRAGSVLSEIEGFDASFFGISPREAKSMDPQHRLLLECAWGALEDAGYCTNQTEQTDTRIGVYTGTSLSTYLHNNLLPNTDFCDLAGDLQIEIGNDKDFAATRISYKLNLRGPSVAVNTACSSSLVAVHLACQSLLDHECDMAIAGGATVQVPHRTGYRYQPDGIASPDGHCRPFDASAAGTVFGSGVGVVVLKRLAEAVADGDSIYAVIKGSAINNDGALKVGYTAPSVEGQAAAIAEAQAIADIDPETISYIEAHGTGTAMGDPIEISALTQAFRTSTQKTGFCAIGSVKGNIGHLNRAAGIVGLIKTALVLKHKQLPPTLHFQQPNPLIDFANSPFYVNDTLQPWNSHGTPRRAGVSSFGIGGTNAHAVLEEAPESISIMKVQCEESSQKQSPQLIVLSAKTRTALATATQNLASYLTGYVTETSSDLANVAFTLQVGRAAFNHRCGLVAMNREEAIAALTSPHLSDTFTISTGSPSVAFMFSGQGSQYVNMAREIYEQVPLFQSKIDTCAQILQPLLKLDLRDLLYPSDGGTQTATEKLQQTAITQPALFAIEYALAQLNIAWGTNPQAMIGHSIGEYVAACIAGVFSLEDALKLVALRGQMMQQLPAGDMLAVFLPQHKLVELLPADISLGTSNSPNASTVSGPSEHIHSFQQVLQQRGVECRSVKTSHAFHSAMMDPILADFGQAVDKLTLQPPQIPFVSNVTGTWITDAEATSTDYWVRHLRQTVRFSEGVALLLQEPNRILLEMGPGVGLRSLAKQQPTATGRTILATTRHPKDTASDIAILYQTLAQLWSAGVTLNWSALHAGQARRRLSLPTYPFEHQRYWVEARPASTALTQQLNALLTQSDFSAAEQTLLRKLLEKAASAKDVADTSNWLYQTDWQLKENKQAHPPVEAGSWIVFCDRSGIGEQLAHQLRQGGQHCILVMRGDQYVSQSDTRYQVNPGELAQFDRLFQESLEADAPPLRGVVHLWGLDCASTSDLSVEALETAQTIGLLSVLYGVRSLKKYLKTTPKTPTDVSPKLWIITQNAQSVATTDTTINLAQSPLWGLGKSISLEEPTLWGGLVDISVDISTVPSNLATELLYPDGEDQLAYRSAQTSIQRYVARLRRMPQLVSQAIPIQDDKTYLITGGLGSIGLQLADWLVKQGARSLVLIGRKAPAANAIATIKQLKGAGATVQVIQADVADRAAIAHAFTTIQATLPPLKGIIHTAGTADHTSLDAIDDTVLNTVCRAKVQGTWNLHQLSEVRSLDFFVCFSSIAAVWGSKTQAAYAAANQFLNDFAKFRQTAGHPTLSISWGPWASSHMATDSIQKHLAHLGITSLPTDAALNVFGTLLSQPKLTQATAADIDWSIFKPFYENASLDNKSKRQFLEQIQSLPADLNHLAGLDDSLHLVPQTTAATSLLETLQTSPVDQHRLLLSSSLHQQVARTLSIQPTQLDASQALNYLGLDSLMAIELKNWIKTQLQVELSTTQLMSDMSANTLTEQILNTLPSPSTTSLRNNPKLSPGSKLCFPIPHPLRNDPKLSPGSKLCYPLSHGQRALWFLHQQDKASTAYNVSIPVRLQGPLNISALQQAIQQLSDRHPTLHTTFPRQPNGEPAQQVHPAQSVRFERIDVADWTESAIQQAVIKAHEQPFDLEQGPIFRACLWVRSTQSHILLLSLHHIIYDAWSIKPLLNDLEQLYSAAKQGQQATLPPLEQQFTDYVRWQQETLSGPEGDRLWKYWQQQLTHELTPLCLPGDRTSSQHPTTQGSTHTFHFSDDQSQTIKAFAKSQGTTAYTVLMAAFQSLLYRYTGQRDILVGSPVGGRPQSAFDRLIGYFVNPVVVKGMLEEGLSFQDFLSQVQTTVLAAMEHHAYPFPLLVERLQPKRAANHAPLFQVLFNFLNLQSIDPTASLLAPEGDTAAIPWSDLLLSPYPLAQQEGQFDLTLEVVETRNTFIGSFKYRTDLFDSDTIERMAGHFQRLLSEAISDAAMPIDQLPMLSTVEQQLLNEWNNTDVDYCAPGLLHQQFEAQAEKTPAAIALTFAGETLTYTALNERANQLAHRLRALGIGPNSLVGICIDRSLEMVIGLYGILKAGGAYVPLDPGYPAERLAYMAKDAGFSVLLTTHKLASLLPDISTGTSAHILYLDQWEALAGQSCENPAHINQPDDIAYMIYTSGSTGQPKGVRVPHQAIVNRLLWMQSEYGLTHTDRVLQKTPFSFDVSVWEFFWPTMVGATLAIARPEGHKDRDYLVQLIAQEHITTVHFVPSMLNVFLRAKGLTKCTSLKRVFCSGEALSARLKTQFFQQFSCELHNLYGPTEAAVDVTYWQCQPDQSSPTVPIGRPVANTQLHILNAALQPQPIGVPGELHIGGIQLAAGYHNRPELTAERFITCNGKRLYKTGDLCCYRRDGTVEYLGRIDHQVKLRGFRIELGEIEQTLLQHPAVQQCVVVAREDKTREDEPDSLYLAAYYVASSASGDKRAHALLDSRSLRAHLAQTLPEYMLPSVFINLPAIPLTPSGKVNRRALPRPVTTDRQSNTYLTPTAPLEKQLADIWAAVLKLDRVGIADNFFEIGGHSLLAVQLIARMEAVLTQPVSLAMLFRTPTIQGLTQALSASQRNGSSGLVVYTTTDDQKDRSRLSTCPPLFFVDSLASFQKIVPYLGSPGNSVGAIYGLTPFGHRYSEEQPDENPQTFIEEIARCLIQDLKKVAPVGPYNFCSFCRASKLTWEMAKQLTAQGDRIEKMILIDAVWGPQPSSSYRHWQNLKKLGPTYLLEKAQYLPKARYKQFRRWILAKFGIQLPQAYQRDPYHRPDAREHSPLLSTIETRDSNQQLLRYYRAIDGYCPQPLPIAVDLLLPAEFLPLNHTTLRENATAGLTIQILPGYHHALFSNEAQLNTLATEIVRILESTP